MRNQRQIKVPPEYFRKAKDEYADWILAWWREAFQNSLDAGATHLDINLSALDRGVSISFKDNGKGMSEHTLLNTFLALGGSEKPGDSIGGFGYAKNLLCFAHKNYVIATGHQRIQGMGGDYEHWLDEDQHVDGVLLEVVIDDERAKLPRFEDSLRMLINASNLPKNVTVTLNGKDIKPEPQRFGFKSNTSIGPLQFRDSSYGPSKLWVRIGGLAMFPVTVWTDDSNFQGIIDLQGSSLELLTSNRDSLRSDPAEALQKVVQQLSNERGALKCNNLLDLTLNFDAFHSGDKVNSDATHSSTRRSQGAGNCQMTSLQSEEQRAQGGSIADAGDHEQQNVSRMMVPGDSRSPEDEAFLELARKRNQALEKIQTRLSSMDTSGYPRTFRIRTAQMGAETKRDPASVYTPVFRKLSLERVQKLARAWEKTIHCVLATPIARMQGIDWEGNRPTKDGRPINTGFVFSDTLEGLHAGHPDGAYDILMNPDCMPRFNAEDMLDIAIHEVTHLWVPGHHEGFTSMELKLRRGMRKFMPISELRKKVRSAIEGGNTPAKSNEEESVSPPQEAPQIVRPKVEHLPGAPASAPAHHKAMADPEQRSVRRQPAPF